MPTLKKVYALTITPEQFIDSCSRNELIELGLLLSSPRIQEKINNPESEYPAEEYQPFKIRKLHDDK